MDTDAELDALFRYEIRIANRHRALDIDGRAHCVHHACKLDKNAISGRVGDTPAIGRYRGIDQLGPQRPDACQRAFLIRAREPRVAGDIRCKNRGELPGLGHDSPSVTIQTSTKTRSRPARLY